MIFSVTWNFSKYTVTAVKLDYCFMTISYIILPPSKMLLQAPGRFNLYMASLEIIMHHLVLTFQLVFDKCEKYSVDVNHLLLACRYLPYLILKDLYWVLSLARIIFSSQLSSIYAICKTPFISKLQKNILQLSHFKLSNSHGQVLLCFWSSVKKKLNERT